MPSSAAASSTRASRPASVSATESATQSAPTSMPTRWTPWARSTSTRSVLRRTSARSRRDVHEEIERALKSGFTAKEIADAKSGLLQSRIVARSTDRDLAN